MFIALCVLAAGAVIYFKRAALKARFLGLFATAAADTKAEIKKVL